MDPAQFAAAATEVDRRPFGSNRTADRIERIAIDVQRTPDRVVQIPDPGGSLDIDARCVEALGLLAFELDGFGIVLRLGDLRIGIDGYQYCVAQRYRCGRGRCRNHRYLRGIGLRQSGCSGAGQ